MITPSNGGDDRVLLQASASPGSRSASAIALVLLGFLDLGIGDLELTLGLGDVFGRDHARLALVEPRVAGHDRSGDFFLGLGFLRGADALGLSLFLVTVSSAISRCKMPIVPSFLTGMPI